MDYIRVRGAKENNLKNVDIDIPRNKLVVFTGLSGSGKSSLAFNTIYAEGHRRYVESLSAYARQFLGQLDKPKVDSIEGLSPTIAIDQKTTSKNPRSTVGTVTEIYDYLRLLYARVGEVYCPNGHGKIEAQSVEEIVNQILAMPDKTKLQIMAPVVRGRKGEHTHTVQELMKKGFVRARIDGEMVELHEDIRLEKNSKHHIEAVVDRIVRKEGIRSRLSDSVELGLKEGEGLVYVVTDEGEQIYSQNHSCKTCGFSYSEISPRSLSFNSPYGGCETCSGLGVTQEVNWSVAVTPNKSIADGCFHMLQRSRYFQSILLTFCQANDIPTDVLFDTLSKKHKQTIQFGSSTPFTMHYKNGWGMSSEKSFPQGLGGVSEMLKAKFLQKENGSEDEDEAEDGLFHNQVCPACDGKRLKREMLSILIQGKDIWDLCTLSISDCLVFFEKLTLSEMKMKIAEQVIKEIIARLRFLNEVGLTYLTLARTSGTLSGGESQRIRLATQIGSGLTGVLYVLDEPSIGLHQRDNDRLLNSLEKLRDLGNSLILVEHDEDTMKMADYIVDIGPGAGSHGGNIMAKGTYEEIIKADTLTADYLSGRKKVPVPKKRRKPIGKIRISGASENNLKNVSVDIPLGVLCSITGVSGSGKSTLINQTLYPAVANKLYKTNKKVGQVKTVDNLDGVDKMINIDQAPIGRTPRSNASTYIGVFDSIRKLYADTNEAKVRGYKIGRFSFNVPSKNGGGRCEKCTGDGLMKIEMHFLSDVYVPCEVCQGKRYNEQTLEVRYKGKNIFDVLEMTVEEAVEFFTNVPRIKTKLQTLFDVGLGYIKLGQPATTLSGGEAQRVKLAAELSKRSTGKTLYLLDEPTTGLHMYDVHKLLQVLELLVEKGNSVLVIEHNLDVIKYSDYVIDLGPEGGNAGGLIVAKGTPEEVAKVKGSYTGYYLNKMGI